MNVQVSIRPYPSGGLELSVNTGSSTSGLVVLARHGALRDAYVAVRGPFNDLGWTSVTLDLVRGRSLAEAALAPIGRVRGRDHTNTGEIA